VGTLPVTWSDDAWQSVQPTYAQILEHPFVQQLQAGTLAQDIFLRYLLDDARYLSGYARALAMISGRLPDTADVALLARSAAGAVEAERVMHAALLGEHGIDIDGPGEPSPTCRLYTSSLISAVATEPVEVALAAVLPCFRVYAEVGAAIAAAAAPDHPYSTWIAMYSDPEFSAITGDVEALADRLAKRAGAGVPERMDAAYAQSTRLEWMFWDSAWRGERWPDV
jgi:thiaminase/transcriptional activator TenA